MTDVIVGIDLGTTNSVIAALIDGRSNPIPVDGHPTMPSAFLLTEAGDVVVGREARNLALQLPERTVLSVKRAMGRDTRFPIGDRLFTPEAISAEILRHLAKAASAHLGQPVRDAVITVPAYFNDAQRRATMRAGELAGLKVLRLLNEPTAAALIYEQALMRDEEEPETIVVYDLGGGTFDVSVLDIFDDVREVRATAGNSELGGDDFDALLLSHFLEVLKSRDGIEPQGDPATMARLRRLAETTKIQLSADVAVTVHEEFLTEKGGKPFHFELAVTRHEFEAMIAPRIEDTIALVASALKDAAVSPGELKRVLLVGGSTRIPLVRQRLRDFLLDLHDPEGFGATAPATVVHDEIDPDLAVGVGAAIQAGLIKGAPVDRILVDVAAHSLGIAAIGSHDLLGDAETFAPIIEKNSVLPASRTRTFHTVVDGQTKLDVKVYQGEAPRVMANVLVDKFTHVLIPAPQHSPVHVRFDYDLDGIVKITVFQPGQTPGEAVRVDVAEQTHEAAPSDVSKVIDKALEVLKGLPEAERDRLLDLINNLEEAEDDELDDAEMELIDFLMDFDDVFDEE